jgi:L-lactate dehydrogenase complex protein LldF
MEEAMVLLRLLVRSATGAELTQYTTFHAGPKRAGDKDGPEEFHIVLVDAGRTKMLAEGLAEMLRCIRCGACMNHCVVFRQVGGHAYGATYPGPMGSVITPSQKGLEASVDLPFACTLNGQCQEVCPVAIPLPKLLRGWRNQAWVQGYEPMRAVWALRSWRFLALRPGLYQLASNIGLRVLPVFARGGWISKLPLAGGWTKHRDMPAPQGGTFMRQYKKRVSR